MSPKVLIVDDEEPIVGVLERSLLARGYEVRTASTGQDALLSLAEETPDAMLLDVNLPDLTGWEVLRGLPPSLRRELPVIVFSASPLAPSRVEEFGPAGVLIKPFPIDALVRMLAEVTSNYRGDAEANGA